MSIHRIIPRCTALALLLLLCAGCPPQGGGSSRTSTSGRVKVKLPKEPDQYDALAACLTDQSAFAKELERLQGLYSDPPRQDAAPRGDNDARYGLSTQVEGGRAALVLGDRYGGPDWTLLCWEQAAGAGDALQSRTTTQADGLKLELQTGGALSITVLARWVNGRYLQVSREVLLGGHDYSQDLHDGGSRWRLSGQWLPYRMLPGMSGPYGVVSDNDFSGEWAGQGYPASLCVPAAAAYSQTHGILLASGDKAARDLSRSYDLRWRLDSDYKDGELLELQYRYYDGVQDDYAAPHLVSGLPLRDSVIVEPFQLSRSGPDASLVEAQTRAVLEHLGALSRSFWFTPKPPAALPPGSAVALEEWVSDPQQLDDALRKAVGIWSTQLNEVTLPDAKLGATGYGGIGALDIGGTGMSADALPVLERLAQQQLPTVQFSDWAHVSYDSSYGKALRGWLLDVPGAPGYDNSAGPPFVFLSQSALNIRLPAAAAWVIRKHCTDLTTAEAVSGYRLPTAELFNRPRPLGQTYVLSTQQTEAWLQLTLAEQTVLARPNAVLAFSGMPSLASPVCGHAYAPIAVRRIPSVVPLTSARMLNLLAYEVFGIEPWISYSTDSLARQVLATTRNIRGHALPASLARHPGFESCAANLDELRKAGGDMLVLHSTPEQAGYTLLNERPAASTQLIAALPGDWNGARSVWIAFDGIGGRVSVDTYNELTVLWEGGGEWYRTLPGGVWKIEHPNPEAVQAGDVVLVKFSPLKAPLQPGGASG